MAPLLTSTRKIPPGFGSSVCWRPNQGAVKAGSIKNAKTVSGDAAATAVLGPRLALTAQLLLWSRRGGRGATPTAQLCEYAHQDARRSRALILGGRNWLGR